MSAEELGHGGGGGEGGGGRQVGGGVEEAVEDGRGGHEEGQKEYQGTYDVAVGPPALAGVAAGQDTDDGDQAGAGDVQGLEKHAELWHGRGQ